MSYSHPSELPWVKELQDIVSALRNCNPIVREEHYLRHVADSFHCSLCDSNYAHADWAVKHTLDCPWQMANEYENNRGKN